MGIVRATLLAIGITLAVSGCAFRCCYEAARMAGLNRPEAVLWCAAPE